jgi:hypothetical protein
VEVAILELAKNHTEFSFNYADFESGEKKIKINRAAAYFWS